MGRLTPLSKIRESEYGATGLAKLLTESPLVRFLDNASAFQEEATDSSFRPANAAGSIQARDIGGGYTPQAVTPEGKQNSTLYLHGGAVKVDETYLEDSERGLSDIKNYLDRRIPLEFGSFIDGYEEKLLRGSGAGSPVELKGLLTILDGTTDIPGFTGKKGVIDAGAADPASGDSFDLTLEANYKTFVKKLRLWIASVPNANGLLMNPTMWATMLAIADAMHAMSESRDRFGYSVKEFDGLPMVKLLDQSILNNEPDNNATPATDTTSIYIVRAAEDQLSVLTNSGLDWKDFDLAAAAKKAGATEWEIRSAWRITREKAIRRVRNIKVA